MKYELKRLIQKSKYAENQMDKRIYVLSKWIRLKIKSENNWRIINKLCEVLSLKMSKEDKGRLITALDLNREKNKKKE
ncbi:hypothetical protein MKY22_06910 [Exiguobacterium sp. FSL W8-0210]|uniref:hypothetical protein n=1 Tax=Exiguobacterium sp. FSL W8-0210 TaxID=2921598 RepID=UPI0030FCA0EB